MGSKFEKKDLIMILYSLKEQVATKKFLHALVGQKNVPKICDFFCKNLIFARKASISKKLLEIL